MAGHDFALRRAKVIYTRDAFDHRDGNGRATLKASYLAYTLVVKIYLMLFLTMPHYLTFTTRLYLSPPLNVP